MQTAHGRWGKKHSKETNITTTTMSKQIAFGVGAKAERSEDEGMAKGRIKV